MAAGQVALGSALAGIAIAIAVLACKYFPPLTRIFGSACPSWHDLTLHALVF